MHEKTAAPEEEIMPFSIGEIRTMYSDILGEDRTLNIYLPAGYHPDSLKRYPVIYLLDGSAEEDFIHIAGLVQFGSFSWINMLPESIVVGIANVDRERDFTFPTNNEEDRKKFTTAGHSAAFIDFLKQEVQPFIREHYRTDAPATLIGQSLGGLVATEILFTQPDLFDNYIIVSPSLWWDDESLLQAEPASFEEKKSIFIAVGKEGEVMERTARELYEKLLALYGPESDLHFTFLPEYDHGDMLHNAAYQAFETIFAATD
jgi:hypothetical protein